MKALVAYATMTGSTAEVAEIIGKVIEENGYQADVVKAGDVKSLEGYDFVIAGTGIRAGKTFKPFDMFIQNHGQQMKQKPNALFVVCLTMKEDTCQNREAVIKYIDKQMSVNPLDVGTFAGVMDFRKIGFLLAAIIKKIDKSGNPEGNFIDADKIRSWTNSLLGKLRQ